MVEPARAGASAFDAATRVVHDRRDRWLAELDRGFSGFLGAHGGYVAAVALAAMSGAAAEDARAPRSLSLGLLAAPEAGRLEITVAVEAVGRSVTTASARLEQLGEAVGLARAVFGASRPSLTQRGLVMPSAPAPEDCQPLIENHVAGAGAGLQIEHRPAGGHLPLTGAEEAELLVWMRLLEARPVDHLLASFLADGAVPALYASLTEPFPIPSIEISLHFGTLNPQAGSEWVLGHIRNTLADDGYAIEEGELWTPDGELVAHARQLRRVLDPRAAGRRNLDVEITAGGRRGT